MKKLFLYFAFWIPITPLFGKTTRTITGSWINVDVVNFFDSGKDHSCDMGYFDNEKFIPLYLSFETENKVKMTCKAEQQIFAYAVAYTNSDTILISSAHNTYKVYLANGFLKLKYNNNLITFKKVSDNYSKDVFGEFIRGVVFANHKTYSFSFSGKSGDIKGIVRKSNFEKTIQELFDYDHAEIPQLGSFKFKGSCLPEMALYYPKKNNLRSPRVLGIIISKNDVKLVENSGKVLLLLKVIADS